jgi:curved DNA-binding protein CbpA
MNDDPYEVLELTHAADEAEIRQSYLARVRKYPPDLAPEEFARTRAAYDALRDPVQRIETLLFHAGGTDTFDAIRAELIRSLRATRFSPEQLFKLAETL